MQISLLHTGPSGRLKNEKLELITPWFHSSNEDDSNTVKLHSGGSSQQQQLKCDSGLNPALMYRRFVTVRTVVLSSTEVQLTVKSLTYI